MPQQKLYHSNYNILRAFAYVLGYGIFIENKLKNIYFYIWFYIKKIIFINKF